MFSGAGGMSVGAESAGIAVRYAVEADPYAAATFAHNHRDTTLIQRDIRKVYARDFSQISRDEQLILFGGPPCQGFSTSNQKNRDFKNENNWLFRDYLRLVRTVKPDWIVFENVKGLIETENGYFLDAVLSGFKKLGYQTNHFVLSSADFGVPQLRNRLFIIGNLHGSSVPKPVPTTKAHTTVAHALKDLPKFEDLTGQQERAYSGLARTSYAKEMRGSLMTCHNNLVTKNAPHVVQRYAHIPQGGNWQDIPAHLMENYADVTRCHTGIYRRLREDKPSVVIGNYRKNMLIHPWEDRGLSVREAARLQSFPDNFHFQGSIGFQQQQVGNAVPPLLAKGVFKQIVSHVN